MTVRELIRRLEAYDRDLPVALGMGTPENHGAMSALEIQTEFVALRGEGVSGEAMVILQPGHLERNGEPWES